MTNVFLLLAITNTQIKEYQLTLRPRPKRWISPAYAVYSIGNKQQQKRKRWCKRVTCLLRVTITKPQEKWFKMYTCIIMLSAHTASQKLSLCSTWHMRHIVYIIENVAKGYICLYTIVITITYTTNIYEVDNGGQQKIKGGGNVFVTQWREWRAQKTHK